MSFNRLAEDPTQFSLVASDGEESVVSVTLNKDDLQLFEALMVAAKAFALSNEAVGTSEAITTRFSDPDDGRLIVDVLKFGNQSSLFVTIRTENGGMTIEAGTVSRNDQKETGPFFDILARIELAVGKKPARPSQ